MWGDKKPTLPLGRRSRSSLDRHVTIRRIIFSGEAKTMAPLDSTYPHSTQQQRHGAARREPAREGRNHRQ